MHILGISAFYHDSAAALVRDGQVVAAAQEERFTRKKHDASFPGNAVDFCMRSAGISQAGLDAVVFYEKPFLKFERLLESYLEFAPRGISSFVKALPLWMREKIWMKNVIGRELGGFSGKMLFPEHHLSHAGSAFFPSPFEEAAFITTDGVGEWPTTSFGVGRGSEVSILSDIRFPHSLGLLYSAFTYYTGFKVNSAEYKVMGLAPYGEPLFKDLILRELIDIKEDGSFRLNMEYFDYPVGLRMTNERFHRLFGGPPRRPESVLTQREMDIARSIQEVTDEVMLRMARHVRKATGMRNLCMAGGVALNCVSNGKILREGIFDEIWLQPASGDAGGALGAALVGYHHYFEGPRKAAGHGDSQQGSYLGPSYSDSEVKVCLDRKGIPYLEIDPHEVARHTAGLIASGHVVGWFQGRMEFGPRALGARSIIGDARDPKMQETMNLKIKFRESFRPFAPSVLAEKASEYFDINAPSPYMLIVADVRPEHRKPPDSSHAGLKGLDLLKALRSDIPAVTHVDHSARIQTVHRETNPLYHEMITVFYELTGCPVIINTSFNVRGEPIVESPEDAYRCFMRTRMDFLVMGRFVLDKKQQPQGQADNSWMEEFELD